jgi:hypothetical protein
MTNEIVNVWHSSSMSSATLVSSVAAHSRSGMGGARGRAVAVGKIRPSYTGRSITGAEK